MSRIPRYLPGGWVNLEYPLQYNLRHITMIGPRGTGKTYSVLKWLIDNHIKFFFLRRTSTELEVVATSEKLNPFGSLNKDMGWNIHFTKVAKDVYEIGPTTINEKGKAVLAGESLGIAMSLTSIANVRGFDAREYMAIVYDEFIPELHVRAIRGECTALLNAVESVNHSREEIGMEPIWVFMCANSNRLQNPIFSGMGIIPQITKMQKKGRHELVLPDRDWVIMDYSDSPIKKRKANTSTYKWAKGTDFARMALGNEFLDVLHDENIIKSCDIRHYNPIVSVAGICIYRHKSENLYYVTEFHSGSYRKYGESPEEIRGFAKRYRKELDSIVSGEAYFESESVKIKLESILNP